MDIFFWKESKHDKLPNPKDHIDKAWARDEKKEKRAVIAYLKAGNTTARYKGWSECRICGKRLGSTDMAHGRFHYPGQCWHYIKAHSVKPPDALIEAAVAWLRDLPEIRRNKAIRQLREYAEAYALNILRKEGTDVPPNNPKVRKLAYALLSRSADEIKPKLTK